MESTHSFNGINEFVLRCLENIISSVSSAVEKCGGVQSLGS
jgi:hypothetical protein